MSIATGTVVMIQHSRAICEKGGNRSAKSLSTFSGKKNLWKQLRSTVSSAASPTEVSLLAAVGEGLVSRYGPYPKKESLADKIQGLSADQESAFMCIKQTWVEEWRLRHPTERQPWYDHTILRVALTNAFSLEATVESLRRMPLMHWQNKVYNVNAFALEADIRAGAVVPLPSIATKAAKDVVYMRPSRFTQVASPMRLLTYTMNCMCGRYEESSECKIALIVDLKGYRFSAEDQESFGCDDWMEWMEFLQGENGPLKVAQVMLVNVSPAFATLWKVKLRSKCRESFKWRFNLVGDAENLGNYLAAGFEQSLPSELFHGKVVATEMAGDFLNYRQALERILTEQEAAAKQALKKYRKEKSEASNSTSQQKRRGSTYSGPSLRDCMSRRSSTRSVSSQSRTSSQRSTTVPLRRRAGQPRRSSMTPQPTSTKLYCDDEHSRLTQSLHTSRHDPKHVKYSSPSA